MLLASVASASFWPAYFFATSLYEGPTSFLSTAWQAMQAFFLAKSALAKAGADIRAEMATAAKINFMRAPIEGFKYNQTVI